VQRASSTPKLRGSAANNRDGLVVTGHEDVQILRAVDESMLPRISERRRLTSAEVTGLNALNRLRDGIVENHRKMQERTNENRRSLAEVTSEEDVRSSISPDSASATYTIEVPQEIVRRLRRKLREERLSRRRLAESGGSINSSGAVVTPIDFSPEDPNDYEDSQFLPNENSNSDEESDEANANSNSETTPNDSGSEGITPDGQVYGNGGGGGGGGATAFASNNR
jgi:hypothetical protein